MVQFRDQGTISIFPRGRQYHGPELAEFVEEWFNGSQKRALSSRRLIISAFRQRYPDYEQKIAEAHISKIIKKRLGRKFMLINKPRSEKYLMMPERALERQVASVVGTQLIENRDVVFVDQVFFAENTLPKFHWGKKN